MISLGLSCVFDFKRIKDYQVSGQDKKIVDPDGEIHLRRLRLELELRSQQTSDNLPNSVTWPRDGWTLSLEQMPSVSALLFVCSFSRRNGKQLEETGQKYH